MNFSIFPILIFLSLITLGYPAFKVGDEVTFKRKDGQIATGKIISVEGKKAEIKWQEGNDILTKKVALSSLNLVVKMKPGDTVIFKRSDGRPWEGKISAVGKGMANVFWEEKGEKLSKLIPLDQL